MKSFVLTAAVVLVSIGMASAQYPPGVGGGPGGPGYRPTTSPYLNLLGRGNPAVNLYGIVRPQQAYNAALFGGGVGATGGIDQQDITDPELRRGTGSRVSFNNLSHYYYNHPAMGGPGMGGIGGGLGRMGGGFGGGAMPMAGGMGRGGMMPGGAGAMGGRGAVGAMGGIGIPRR